MEFDAFIGTIIGYFDLAQACRCTCSGSSLPGLLIFYLSSARTCAKAIPLENDDGTPAKARTRDHSPCPDAEDLHPAPWTRARFHGAQRTDPVEQPPIWRMSPDASNRPTARRSSPRATR